MEKSAICLLIINLILFSAGYSADVLFVDAAADSSEALKQVQLACRFYGLDLHTIQGERELVEFSQRQRPLALVMTAHALPSFDLTFAAINKNIPANVPLLILQINPLTDSQVLSEWSGLTIRECRVVQQNSFSGFYRFGKIREIARQLSGQTVSFAAESKISQLLLSANAALDTLLEIAGQNEVGRLPLFVKTTVNARELFFQTDFPSFHFPPEIILKEEIFELLPLLMFLRYAAGERGWHSVGHYANFTIDDPWLTEPYGRLSYSGLLAEMEKAKFHTTIAFIPWNFDRSQPEVVRLFRGHPDQFSICIHGNNHDHREFYKYEAGLIDYSSSKPLQEQEENLQQALARMEKFKSLTGISYDRVMIFPHGIAPEKTLGLLKRYNYLATVNGINVPWGASEPGDLTYYLRSVTLRFANFPSIARFSPGRTRAELAIELFLDNPLLFYTHHDFFQKGINEFNKTARFVNQLCPDIVWQSLGEIVQKLYLQKRRDDGNYDLLAFTSNFVLENKIPHDITYFVRKEESLDIPVQRLTMDGESRAYECKDGYLSFQLTVPANATRHIVIEYGNEFDFAAINVLKDDYRVALLRYFSDFRDRVLSKYFLGRAITRVYYEYGLFKLGLLWLVFVIVVMAAGGWYLKIRAKRRYTPKSLKSLNS